jgi:hypothetical protein
LCSIQGGARNGWAIITYIVKAIGIVIGVLIAVTATITVDIRS